jgi:hypothetical protein
VRSAQLRAALDRLRDRLAPLAADADPCLFDCDTCDHPLLR